MAPSKERMNAIEKYFEGWVGITLSDGLSLEIIKSVSVGIGKNIKDVLACVHHPMPGIIISRPESPFVLAKAISNSFKREFVALFFDKNGVIRLELIKKKGDSITRKQLPELDIAFVDGAIAQMLIKNGGNGWVPQGIIDEFLPGVSDRRMKKLIASALLLMLPTKYVHIAAYALASIGNEEDAPHLLKALRTNKFLNGAMAQSVGMALEKFKFPKELIPELIDTEIYLLTNIKTHEGTSPKPLEKIMLEHKEQSIPYLVSKLDNEDEKTREYAARLLYYAAPDSVPELNKIDSTILGRLIGYFSKETAPDVKVALGHAFWKLKPKEAMPVIEEALSGSDPESYLHSFLKNLKKRIKTTKKV